MQILRGIMLGIMTMIATGGALLYYTETNAQRELESVLSATDITELEGQVHAKINTERAEHGLNPLRYNPQLVEIARTYSQEMARNNFLSHEDLQGRNFSDRYSDAGFTCAIRDDIYIHGGAENLYLMHVGKKLSPFGSVAEYYTHDEIASEVVDGWMDSSGHRHNILTEYWQSEGIGVAIDKDGRIYVTQNFC